MEVTPNIEENILTDDGGPGKPTPPKGYVPLSTAQRTDWNSFLDNLKSQGNVNLNDPQVGLNFLNQYKQNNPNFSITPEQIPFIQYEAGQLRKGDAFGNLTPEQLKYVRSGLSPNFVNAQIPEANGQFNPQTAGLYYPQYTKGGVKYGTDIEGYANSLNGAPHAIDAPIAQPIVSPIGPGPKPLVQAELRKKYSGNPYLMEQGRYNWGSKLENEFPLTGGKVKDAVVNAAKFNGIDSALLYSSAMEEGMSGSVDARYSGNASEPYVNWAEKNSDKAEEYPVDGFYNYGLDQFAGMAAGLEKKGYLPKKFANNFVTFDAVNEKGEKLKAPAFKKDSDALIAKSAMMRLAKDELEEYIPKAKIKLTPKQKDFFLLANYNGGKGLMQKMLQSYKDKGYLNDDKFLDTKFKPASYREVYNNVQARLQSAQQLKDEKSL